MDIVLDDRRAAAPEAQAGQSLDWLTGEVALYGLFVCVAVAIRLGGLSVWPLLDAEIGSALAAWRALQGVAQPTANYVPLLYDANLALFALTRATDAATRLLPALVGSALVLKAGDAAQALFTLPVVGIAIPVAQVSFIFAGLTGAWLLWSIVRTRGL